MAEKKNRKALKRGLDDIFGVDVDQYLNDIQSNNAAAPGRKEVELPISQIRANPYQPRKDFDPKALKELSESIKTHGIFTPLLVRPSVQGYELIAGERRLRAAKMAGLTTVPAVSVDFTEEQMMEISLLENIQREDLNPIEEAAAYAQLMKRLGYTQEQLAQRVGKSREYCANMLRLLNLPESVQQLVAQGKLTMGHVRPLLALKDPDKMYDAALYIEQHKLSVREVEAYVRTLQNEPVRPKKKKVREKDPLIRDVENRMISRLGTRVEISPKAITIAYSDTQDLNRILELLGMIEEE